MHEATRAQERALAILTEFGPMRPGDFGQRMWPEAKGHPWRKPIVQIRSSGKSVTVRGAQMRGQAGRYLAWLAKAGLILRDADGSYRAKPNPTQGALL